MAQDESSDADDDRSSSERRTGAASGSGPYPDAMHRQLMTPTAPLAPGAALRVYPMPPAPPSVPARWAKDPTGRHQWRWWNGRDWTPHVADDGQVTTDPLE